jgi:single-stranded-DNA-specific exonuclease
VKKRWVIAAAEPALTRTLARELHLPLPLAQTLVNRGYRDADAARRFLDPKLRDLGDPFELPDMNPAVERVLTGIEKKERIVIYGDYDVDGVTSSALLTRVLSAAGATVTNFLPQRMDEGYGLSIDGITRCLKEHKPQLLVAVDCGTSSIQEIADLKKHGVDTVVLDHHEPPKQLPECLALVNPKRRDDGEPLASVGVSFKLAHALLKRVQRLTDAIDLRDHLDLVALGTVADIVPLTGENRILVKAGLERLPDTQKVGLRALLDVADVPDKVSPYHIGFRIGPRLNAAGRLADAMAALELLLTDDHSRAAELAKLLDDHNAERQRIEEQIVEQVLAQAEKCREDRVLVLADDKWHVGVIGIVASRVMQEFYRPTVVIGKDGKGSCRSISGFSIVEALSKCAPLLERYGGHEMAAGLSIKASKIPELRRRLNEIAGESLKTGDLSPRVFVDAVVRLVELDDDFFKQLERFEPCGTENPSPIFAVCGATIRGEPRVLKEKHVKFRVTDGDVTVEAIWFGMAGTELPRGALDVAFVPEVNEYGGVETVQLKVKDVRPAAK